MIKTTKLLLSLWAIVMVVLVTSCDDETDISGGGGIPVADGFYITKSGVDPVSSGALVSEVVEADGFATQAREGFFGTYIFLAAGNYNVVNVIDQKISQTFGGTAVTETNDNVDNPSGTGSECNLHAYTLIEEATLNGASFAIAADGLYKVNFDNSTKEIVIVKIEKAHVIGGATSFGWSQNDDGQLSLVGSASAEGVTFKATNLSLKKGSWKVRFNCRWSIDRRIDPTAGFAAANGYVNFTNFGGTTTLLAPGGTNLEIPFGQDGKYTVEVTWTPKNGVKLTTTNTAPIAPKAVNSYEWGIIGDATPGGWDADTDLTLLAGSTATAATYEIASVAIAASKDFKFRANNEWGIVLKPGIDILGTETGSTGKFTSTGGGDPNWKVADTAGGNYKITIATTNGGEKWNVTFVKL